MPYKLKKAPSQNLYWVVAEDGKHMSIKPIPLERAKRQLAALYVAMKMKGEKTFQKKVPKKYPKINF